jgi:hypothetical protein
VVRWRLQKNSSRTTTAAFFKYSWLSSLIVGVLLLIFGTTYIVVGSDTVGTYLFQPIWYVFTGFTNVYSGAVVIFTDYTLNAVGIALVILGTVFATVRRKGRVRKFVSGILIVIGAASVFAGYEVYGIYRSIPPIAPSPLEPYFPATNVPLLEVVRLVPLMNSLMIDGALFIAGGLILLLLLGGKKRTPVSEKSRNETEETVLPRVDRRK